MDLFSTIPWNEMPFCRLKPLGHGSYGVVYLVVLKNFKFHKLLAMKTASLGMSTSLIKEKRILDDFRYCPEIIDCLGDNTTTEEGFELYNVLLEYAPLGTLSELIRRSQGCALPETKVRIYTRMILKGLRCLHAKGYVHCDLKPDNILVFPPHLDGCCRLKIADFGLAKEPDEVIVSEKWKNKFRGTPLYMSPESVALGEIGPSLDIWSLGCIVVEMIIGKRALHGFRQLKDVAHFLACTEGTPIIPQAMTETGKDFLRKCFERDPRKRWSAHMLLQHPYVCEASRRLPAIDSVLLWEFSMRARISGM